MAIRLDVLKHLDDLPVRADEKRRAAHAHVLAPHELLLPPNPIELAHLLVFVGQERKGEVELLPEGGVGARRVGADTKNDGPGAGEAAVIVAEPASFFGASGGASVLDSSRGPYSLWSQLALDGG